MRLTKRILLTLGEAALLLFLSTLTIVLAVFLKDMMNVPHSYGFLLGSVLSLWILLRIQARTLKWKYEYDAEKWIRGRSELSLHPNRPRYLRIVHCLLWLPSGCASIVLFFFPVATHLVHPSLHLGNYRLSLPWTWTVLLPPFTQGEYSYFDVLISTSPAGRLGVTPFWEKDASLSVATFGSFGRENEHRRDGATQVSRREIHIAGRVVACWQYVPSENLRSVYALPKGYWKIDCDIPASTPDLDFYAEFSGLGQDIPAFYYVLEHVRKTD